MPTAKRARKKPAAAPAPPSDEAVRLLREMQSQLADLAREQAALASRLAEKDAQLARLESERASLLRVKSLYERRFAQMQGGPEP